MELTNGSYVYFALSGMDFDPDELTNKLGIEPSDSWRRFDKGKYNQSLQCAYWELSSKKGQEPIFIENMVEEIVAKFFDKIEIINELKLQFQLDSVLEIVLKIDSNQAVSTPSLGHNLKTIEFLYRTQTKTDVDIYRFDSSTQ